MHHILVIDDDNDSLEICRRILTDESFTVSTHSDGEGAIGIIRTLKPSLILTDWDMPGKGGLELLVELQADQQLRSIPVIVMTGRYTSSNNLRMALDKGATDFISKPLNAIELVARLKSAVKTYQYFKEKEALLNESIEQKEREVYVFHTNIIRHKQLLASIKKDLKSLFPDSSQQQKAVVQLIEKYEIQNNHVNSDATELVFNELSSEFAIQLKQIHPTLTRSEIKLCIFLRMGYSYKEISNLLYMGYEAVRKAIFRIKLKLNLSHVSELVDYLQKLN